MTQAKFMKLYVELIKGNITASQIADLKYFSDKEIDLIMSMNNQSDIKKLLMSKEYKNLDEPTQRRLISIIETYANQSFSTHYAIQVATNKDVIERGKVLELTKLIISNDRVKEHAELAYNAAINPFILKNENAVAVVISIINATNLKEATQRYEEAMKSAYTKELAKNNNEDDNLWNLFISSPISAFEAIATSIFPNVIGGYEIVTPETPVLAEPTSYSIKEKEIDVLIARTKKTEIPSYTRVRKRGK